MLNEHLTGLKKLLILIVFITAWLPAQTLSSNLQKKTITLGEPDVYKIRIENLGGQDVVIAPKNELLPFHFEEIKDSINKQQDVYERIIDFAVFEEGKFTIPAFEVVVGGKVQKTVPYEVEVVNTAKKGDEIGDIMSNKEVKLQVQDYWQMYKWYILGALTLLALIFVVWQVVRYGRKKKDAPVVYTNQTLKELETLKKKNYIENGDYRSFYVIFINIIRKFLSQQYRIPADVLLTDDLVAFMKKNQTISQENEAVLEDVFLRGDLVKFAKTFPDRDTMQKDFDEVKALVKRSAKDLEFEKLRRDV